MNSCVCGHVVQLHANRTECVVAECPCRAFAERDMVDHPAHYGGADNPYETIKVMRAWHGDEAVYWFCVLSAEKYLSRAGKKGDAAEDLRKARWYADYAATLREGK